MQENQKQPDLDFEMEEENLEEMPPEDLPMTNRELEEAADELLRAHAKEIDPETGKVRGLKGDAPILFAEHLYSRRRREIQVTSTGVPDPAYTLNDKGQPGMYWRVAPNGRRVNSTEARKNGGASFFR